MKLNSRWTLYALALLILFAALGLALFWKTLLLGFVGLTAWRYLYRQAFPRRIVERAGGALVAIGIVEAVSQAIIAWKVGRK